MKILMLKGLPGSGKSTWAKEFVKSSPDWVRINKDSIRAMIGYTQKKEDIVLTFRDAMIVRALIDKKSVVIDDTNFHPKHEAKLRWFAETLNAEFEVKVFDTPLHECIQNDLKREESVGVTVIRRMHEQYVRPAISKYQRNDKLPKAIICDLDGTIALANGRNVYDASTCDQDAINTPVAELVWKYGRDDYEILFTSGREDCFRPQTMKFLARAGMSRYQLFMRATGDKRKDWIVKRELFDAHIRDNYNVELVLDDRQRVVDMWRDIGLTVLQVADGNF